MALLFLLVSILQMKSAHAYANWLKCYIEFDDEEEVIMHHPIVQTKDQSEERKAYIEIQPYASPHGAPWMASTQQEHEELFPSSIYNTNNATTTTTTTATATTTTLLKLRLRVPPSLKRKDVQFVVEVIGEGVSFVGQGVMCDGRRAFSQQHDKHVLLQMNYSKTKSATSTTNEIENPDDEASALLGLGDNIELVAGWAAGYEAVKLTPKMILSRSLGETMNDDNDRAGSSDQRNDVDRGDEL
jgi:hypothetical protein